MAPTWLAKAIEISLEVSLSQPSKEYPFANAQSTKTKSQGTTSFAQEFGLAEDSSNEMNLSDVPIDSFFEMPESADLAQPGAPNASNRNKHAVIITDDMLTQPIPEGQRDNTMTSIVGHYCANADLRRLGKDMILRICLEHNEKYCQPPLADQAIMDKVNYFFNIEAAKTEGYKAQKSDRPIFKASEQAKNVLKYLTNQGILLEYDPFTHVYYYCSPDQGPWNWTTNTLIINHWIRDVVKSPHYGDPSWDKRSYVDETRVAIEESFSNQYQKESKFDIGFHQNELSKYIIVDGSMLDWRTGELKDWDPKYKTTIAFSQFEYEPSAECPHFEQYLSEWLPDEKVRLVVQEYLGYCLIPDTSYRKALYLYGRGRNGKSVFLEMLQEFFAGLSSTLSYDDLFQRFGTADLQNKTVNIYDDTTISFTKDTGLAKNIIAGGKLRAERKGRDAFEFTNVARLIYSAQEMPRTADTTLAWYDRWFFVRFMRTFEASGSIKHEMQDNMRTEFSGIFNWMLRGLQRLNRQGKFTACEELRMTTLEYRGLNDNVVQFITNCTKEEDTIDVQKRISTSDWYKIYEIFAEKENIRKVARKTFITRMEDAGCIAVRGTVNSKQTTFYKNMVLNVDYETIKDSLLEINLARQLK
jgi:putative DNA primase/helicase